jgi:hypothetical protein
MTSTTTDNAIAIPGAPPAGERRYWIGRHQPQKKATPLRIELRERTNQNSQRIVDSFSRLIAFEDVVAQPAAIIEGMEKIIERASRVDEFVGILAHDGKAA